eukprot:TRINITY_DN1227_c0_g1_i3.p1 TRINITY_DN1227_c0_g1~~TRINITY_DN1227_c0_g1_i3.p1  ORF type:complete len:535 (-),score=160.08 TRINITY_DN1227_c0_g1_i3:62-1588(-)
MSRSMGGYDRNLEDASAFQVMVTGFKANTSVEVIMNALATRSGHSITYSNAQILNHRLFFTVTTQREAEQLCSLSPFLINNDKVTMSYSANAQRRDNMKRFSAIERAMQEYVGASYDQRRKYLDMSSVNSKIKGVTIDFNSPSLCNGMWRTLLRVCPSVETVNFANNGIKTLAGFVSSASLKFLRNFCFSNNEIAEVKDIGFLKHIRIMRELDFRQNPVVMAPGYKTEVEHMFASLRFLDGEQVKYLRNFRLPSFCGGGVVFPPMLPFYCDDDTTRSLATQFLTKYFELFDKQRELLLDAYSDTSRFSITVTMPEDRTTPSKLTSMDRFDRNLLRRTSIDSQRELLRTGRLRISEMIVGLPPTSHRLADCSMDAYVSTKLSPSSPVMLVHTLGPLVLGESNVAFNRTFVLVPNPNSRGGWPVTIVNDQLHLRPLMGPVVPPPQPPAPATPALDGQRQAMVQQLMGETRLVEQYALQCLDAASWDYQRALSLFQISKDQSKLPPEAFRQ